MIRLLSIALMAVVSMTLLNPAPLLAQDEVDEEAELIIESSVQLLASDDPTDHEKARQNFVLVGEAAIPALKKAMQYAPNPAVRRRAQAIIDEIESKATAEPTLVTLKLDNVHPREAFDALGKQAGIAMRPDWDEMWNQRQIPKQISVDFQQKPFWSAMLELCEQTKVGFSPHGNPGEIRLSNHRQFSGKTVKEGAFTIVATNASRRMSVNYGSEQTPQNNLNLQFYVLPDPSLEVISGRQLMTVLEAIDADGKSLKRDSDQYGDMYSRQIAWNSNASLDPNTTAKSLKSFKGLTRFTVVTESETLEVPDILNAKDVTKAAAWRTVTVKELKKIDHGYQLSISYQTTGTPDNDLANAAQPSNIQLLDADGNAYVANGYSGGGNSRTGMNYEITFIDPASRRGGNAPSVKEPAKLVWQIPTKSRGLVVTFEMNDMPLP